VIRGREPLNVRKRGPRERKQNKKRKRRKRKQKRGATDGSSVAVGTLLVPGEKGDMAKTSHEPAEKKANCGDLEFSPKKRGAAGLLVLERKRGQ